MARQGFDVTEARRGSKHRDRRHPRQAAGSRATASRPRCKTDRQGRSAKQRFDELRSARRVVRRLPPVLRRHLVGHVDPDDDTVAVRKTLYQELHGARGRAPDLVKQVSIGTTINGMPIVALKVTKNARDDAGRAASRGALQRPTSTRASGSRPRSSRRLLHLFVDNYGDPSDTAQARPTTAATSAVEAAPDQGRDHPDRQHRTSCGSSPSPTRTATTTRSRPTTACGARTCATTTATARSRQTDGVDPNRNYPDQLGLRQRGLLERSRERDLPRHGPGVGAGDEGDRRPAQARRLRVPDQLPHGGGAAALPDRLPGQTTYTADDPIYRALSGTDDDSAIKGHGEPARRTSTTRTSAPSSTSPTATRPTTRTQVYGTLAWTPELDVADPDAGGGGSVFEFQDSEDDVEAAFEKNIPFALDVAKSAADPANPVSHLGNRRPTSRSRRSTSPTADPQDVQVDAKRELGNVTMHYRINGGAEQTAPTKEWDGGERYGGDSDIYYHRLRGTVKGTKPGDEVRVWFEGGGKKSQSFTYTQAQRHERTGADPGRRGLLGQAGEPSREPGLRGSTKPNYLRYYTDALHGQRRRLRRLGRRRPRPHGAGPARRAQPLQGGDLVHGRRPADPIEPDQPPAGTGASKLAQDEIRERPRLPQRGRQAALHGQEGGLTGS